MCRPRPGLGPGAGREDLTITRVAKHHTHLVAVAALAAIRSKNTYLAAQYQRLKPRLGHGRALGAVKHSILIAY